MNLIGERFFWYRYRIVIVSLSYRYRIVIVSLSYRYRIVIVSLSYRYRIVIVSLSYRYRIVIASLSCAGDRGFTMARLRIDIVNAHKRSASHFLTIT